MKRPAPRAATPSVAGDSDDDSESDDAPRPVAAAKRPRAEQARHCAACCFERKKPVSALAARACAPRRRVCAPRRRITATPC
jgi:hypothetical protein